MSLPEARIFSDAEHLVSALADALCAQAEVDIRARGTFHLVLAGGNTPRALYRALAMRGAGDAHWVVWYGDERCVAADDPERNSLMAETAWLAASGIPPVNRHAIPAERGARDAADAYSKRLEGVGDFDLVLLGMGEDGHTASLFPGRAWGVSADSADALAVYDAPKPPPERVSLSAARLSRSRRVWFLVSGGSKREAMRRWREGEPLPVGAVHARTETLVWLDRAAAP